MDLKDFVAESLKEVMDGVKDAQEHAAINGAEVCPKMLINNHNASKTSYYTSQDSGKKVAFVDFDVAVSAEGSTEKGGGGKIGVKVAVFEAGGGGEIKKKDKEATISRLQFSLPIVWPTQMKKSE